MEQQDVHALTAAYALDALDEREEREYEEHLRGCESCRAELAMFTDTATELAYAVEAPAPPPALRDRILESARSERAVVVPFRPRRTAQYLLGGLAAAAAAAAAAFGLWAGSLSDQLEQSEAVAQVLADPDARSAELSGAANGRVVVAGDGEAVLVVDRLDPAPSGKDYQAWVIEGQDIRSAGVFQDADEAFALDERVPEGAVVAVTVEADGGVDQPTGEPIFSAQT